MCPLSDLLGRDGITKVLPPGQCGAEEAKGLPRARGALQDAVHFLNGVKNRAMGTQGEALEAHSQPT